MSTFPGLKPYQLEYLLKLEARNLQLQKEKEQELLNKKREYAHSIYRRFYLGNGSRQMKRSLYNGVSPYYDWLNNNRQVFSFQ
jgi:hypothetical protein